MFHFKLKPYKEFNEWCKSWTDGPEPESITLSNLTNSNPATDEQYADAIDGLNRRIHNNEPINIHFNIDVQPPTQKPVKPVYVLSGEDSGKMGSIYGVTINRPTHSHQLKFRNMRMGICNLDGVHGSNEPVFIDNCEIGTLNLTSQAKAVIRNTKIGTLIIKQARLIDMEGGCVLNIDIDAPGSTDPLTGSVDFVNTFFPRNRKNYLLPGPQPYRNMRHHLRAIENGQMANLFHSNELAVERERDTGMNKFLSYAYQALSDFGSSAFRPIVWWFVIGAFSAIVIFSTNGATPTFGADKYPGWKAMLFADSCDSSTNAVKATYLSFSTMLNPLGLMGHRALLVPSTGGIFIMLVFQALLSAILIALIILAIRRRFKMQ